MVPKCRAGPPAGTRARITGYVMSALGGPPLSFDGILGRVVLSSPGGHVLASLGGVLFTFELNSVFRLVPQGEVDTMSTKTPPRERPAFPPQPCGRVRLPSPWRPPGRSAPRSVRCPGPRPTAGKASKSTPARGITSASSVPPAHQGPSEDDVVNDQTAGEPAIDSIEAPDPKCPRRRRARRRSGGVSSQVEVTLGASRSMPLPSSSSRVPHRPEDVAGDRSRSPRHESPHQRTGERNLEEFVA